MNMNLLPPLTERETRWARALSTMSQDGLGPAQLAAVGYILTDAKAATTAAAEPTADPIPADGEAIYTVVMLVDAWVRYEAKVCAENADQARDLAIGEQIVEPGHGYKWEETGLQQFDERIYGVEDEDGNELVQAY